jgi:hypothetical protein
LDRRLAREPSAGHAPALCLDREIGGGPAGIRALLTEGRDREDDQSGEALAPLAPRERSRLEALHHEIRPLDQLEDGCITGLPDDGAFRAGEELEERSVLTGEILMTGRPAPQRIALRRLDLDHVCAGIGQELRDVGARNAAAEVDHANSAQALHATPPSGYPEIGPVGHEWIRRIPPTRRLLLLAGQGPTLDHRVPHGSIDYVSGRDRQGKHRTASALDGHPIGKPSSQEERVCASGS